MPEATAVGGGLGANLPLYLRAVLPQPGVQRAKEAPDTVLRLTGVTPDRDHVAAYAAIVGHTDPQVLPLFYPHVLGFGLQLKIMTDPTFPMPALGMVHTTNVVTTTGRIPVGTPLDVAVRVGGIRPHSKGRVVDFVTEAAVAGEVVWSETSTYLSRGKTTGEAPAEDKRDLLDGVTLHASAQWRLPGDLGRQYAGVSGDVNPIHLYPLTAKALGFNRQIVHGMWTAAAVAGALENRLPDALTYEVQFRRPIPLPSSVWLHTAVTDAGAFAEVRRKDQVALVGAFRPAT